MPVRAHATLLAGCDFILRHPVSVSDSPNSRERYIRRRLIANLLRELDCFLSVLLGDLAASLEGSEHDAARFARLSNSAKKLHAIELMAGLPSEDGARLRAICGVAARLRRSKERGSPISETIDNNQPVPLQKIVEFYRRIGDRCIGYTNKSGRVIDLKL